MDAWNDLKWFVGVLIFLFFVWMMTGGPERFISRSGPYLEPPTIEDDALGYGELGLPDVSLGDVLPGVSGGSVSTGVDTGTYLASNSSFEGKIKIGRGNAKSEDYGNEEYIILKNATKDESINITGWKLQNNGSIFGGQQTISIPRGTYLFDPDGSVLSDIILLPGEEAIVLSGNITRTRPIKINYSFKVNKCSGYLDKLENYDFTPSLSTSCPLIKDEPEVKTANSSCYDAISRIGRCVTADFEINDDDDMELNGRVVSIGSECRKFIEKTANYENCIERHAGDADFFDNEWRVFLGEGELWNENREVISLYDNLNRLVARISY